VPAGGAVLERVRGELQLRVPDRRAHRAPLQRLRPGTDFTKLSFRPITIFGQISTYPVIMDKAADQGQAQKHFFNRALGSGTNLTNLPFWSILPFWLST
jgi:hypothetical protein